MANIKISQLPVLANPVDTTKIPVVDGGGTKTISASSMATYVSGRIPWDSVLPTATTSVLGGVKVDGSTIVISGTGVISSQGGYSLPTASTTVTGGVRVDGTSITIASGVITASTSSLVNGVHTLSLGTNGNTTFPTGLVLGAPRGSGTVNFTSAIDKEFQIETGTASYSKLWRFETNGNTTLPTGLTFRKNGASYSTITADLDKVLQIETQTSGGVNQWSFGTDGKLTAPGNLQVDGGKIILNTGGNAYVESVDYGVNSANSAVNIFGGPYQKIKLRAGFGTEATWTFGTNGTTTFPNNSIKNSLDNSTAITTQRTLTANNSYTNVTDFSTDVDLGSGMGVIAGWYQRTLTQIEFSLFGPSAFISYLTGLALGRTVIVTYNTSGGTSTLTRTLTQLFASTGQTDSNNPTWSRVTGRIDATLPVGQLGIVSINFPVYSTSTNDWTFATDGRITFPNNSVQATAYLGTASPTQIGGVLVPVVGTSGITNTTGTIGLATASNSQLGGVKVDASSITIDGSGIISVPAVATIGLANGIATLGSDGKLTAGQIPSSAVVTGGSYSDPSWLTLTASKVGLGSVTNESKTTMFASPTFTGTVAGVTATMVGLGSVTNESKTTMFASPTFTGTVAGVTATMVGLGNVTNESKATMFTSPTFTGLLTAQQSTEVYAVKSGTGGTGDYDFSTASIWLVNVDSVGQFAINFTNVPTTINRTTVVTLILQQGTTPYGPSSFSIAGAAQTIKWIGGATPTFGSNRYEILSFTLIRLANATWGAVLGSLSSFS